MTTLSEFYRLTGPLPFVDVQIDGDTRLFVDPHMIRLIEQDDPTGPAAGAGVLLDTFMETVSRGVMASTGPERESARRLLLSFREPRETRLGLSMDGFNGRGTAEDLGNRIWEALNVSLKALVKVGLLGHVEELPIFVEGVAEDRVSDLTTRILFDLLIKFTNQMVESYPQMANSGGLVQHTLRLWDPAVGGWTGRECLLPSAGRHPVVLVPKAWTRQHVLFTSERYFGKTVLDRVQVEQLVTLATGAILKRSKAALRETVRGSRAENVAVTLRAFADGENLARLFTDFVDRKFLSELDASFAA